ncbi:MAG: hypothetical protein C4325_09245, partial [Blastocatellia bacterium]
MKRLRKAYAKSFKFRKLAKCSFEENLQKITFRLAMLQCGGPASIIKEAMAAVILFDGECNFCNYWVNLVIQHDKPGYFRFAPLKSTVSRNLIAGTASDLAVNKLPDSLLLVEDGKIYWEAAAILRIIRRLAWFWPAFYLLLPIPRSIINTVYRKI